MPTAARAARRSSSAPAAPASTASRQTDGILVDVRRHWGGVEVARRRRRASGSDPAPCSATSTACSRRYGRRLGPDPASTDIATVGGVIANNSGGMRCGVDRRLLPDGALADVRAAVGDGDRHRRARRGGALRRRRARARRRARGDPRRDPRRRRPAERIRRKFEIKNTTGYRLCAFLDADEPLEIFRRLLVGSEGTLAFIAEAVFETVPLPARDDPDWIHFDSIARGDRARSPTSSPPARPRSS